MPDSNEPPDDARRFIDALNHLHHVPTWHEAAGLGVRLIDLSREERAIRDELEDLEQTDDGFDAIVDNQLAEALQADIADRRARLDQIEARPDRYFLATGQTVQRDHLDEPASVAGRWADHRTTRITTPTGDRLHRAGVDPTASIHPTAHVDPKARVEAGATIGRRARIGPYAHIGRDAIIGEHCVIKQAAWVSTASELWSRSWIGDGATVEAHCIIGHHTTVGAGSRVKQGAEIEPYSRLGPRTTTSTPTKQHSNRSVHFAHAIENIMRLDHD